MFIFLGFVSFKKSNNAQGGQSRVTSASLKSDSNDASAARTLQNGSHLQPPVHGMHLRLTFPFYNFFFFFFFNSVWNVVYFNEQIVVNNGFSGNLEELFCLDFAREWLANFVHVLFIHFVFLL